MLALLPGAFQRSLPVLGLSPFAIVCAYSACLSRQPVFDVTDAMADDIRAHFNGAAELRVSAAGMGGSCVVFFKSPELSEAEVIDYLEREHGCRVARVICGPPLQILTDV